MIVWQNSLKHLSRQSYLLRNYATTGYVFQYPSVRNLPSSPQSWQKSDFYKR
jgi:hypothetical protein